MVKKIIFLIGIVTLSGVEASYAQEEKKQFIHKGLLRAQGTISPGILVKEDASTISLHGGIEYYIASNISVRGDSYYFLEAKIQGINSLFDYNHSTFAGASYHFKTKNNFDPYLAVEPGIAISKSKGRNVDCSQGPCPPDYPASNITANPLISSAIGFNFYFQKLFHLFGEARFISGKHLSDAPKPLSLNELRFSFGLGFNLSVFKQKTTPVGSK